MPPASSLQHVTALLSARKPALLREYGLTRIGVFGSFARGEQGPESDVDLLVELARPIGLFRFQRLENELAELLSRRVDLVTRAALKPSIGARILDELKDV